MMSEKMQYVAVDIQRYTDLLEKASLLDLLLDVIFDSAKLGMWKDGISFGSSGLNIILKYAVPERYAEKMQHLLAEAETGEEDLSCSIL